MDINQKQDFHSGVEAIIKKERQLEINYYQLEERSEKVTIEKALFALLNEQARNWSKS